MSRARYDGNDIAVDGSLVALIILDGNSDTSDGNVILLRIYDGNPGATQDELIIKQVWSKSLPLPELHSNHSEGYADGNKDFYTTTKVHYNDGDGNISYIDGNKFSFSLPLYNDNWEWTTAGDRVQTIRGNSYRWYKETDNFVNFGPLRLYDKRQLVAGMFNRTVENIRGTLEPETRVHIDGTYNCIQSKIPLEVIRSNVSRIFYRYEGELGYWYDKDVIIVGSRLDDDSGLIYNEDGKYIMKLADAPIVLYDPCVNEPKVHRVYKYLNDKVYTFAGQTSIYKLPYKYVFQTSDSGIGITYTPEAGINRFKLQGNAANSLTVTVSIGYPGKMNMVHSEVVSGEIDIIVDLVVGIKQQIYVSVGGKCDWVRLTGPKRENYIYTTMTQPKYYLFDYTLVKDLVQTNSSGYVNVNDHDEFRLKGPVFFPDTNDIFWCVLEYQKPNLYLVIKTKPITSPKSLVNKNLFPSIEVNPYKII